MTISAFLYDTEELIEYLIKRFGRRKIFLVGHSWGSILGIKLSRDSIRIHYDRDNLACIVSFDLLFFCEND